MGSVNEVKQEYITDIIIATSTIYTPSIGQPLNKTRNYLLQNIIKAAGRKADVIVLPAGFFKNSKEPKNLYNEIERLVVDCLKEEELNSVICLGIDGRKVAGICKDQIGIAIGRDGIISVARKFYTTQDQESVIKTADSPLSLEDGYKRIFKVKNKSLYLAVCYDSYGIRKCNIDNPNVDAILDLVHGFLPRDCGSSGDVYFAKYGFAGSSMQWNCPTFGAATFFNREVPENWPTGVKWNKANKNLKEWHYDDNEIHPISMTYASHKDETALIRFFAI